MEDESNKSSGSQTQSGLGETLKKVFSAGVSAAFMTEESIKSYLQDVKLPKEILSALLHGAGKSKDEVTKLVSQEAVKIISKIDWVREVSRFVEGHKFKISAEIEVTKKDSKN
jgi:hypothetical protein